MNTMLWAAALCSSFALCRLRLVLRALLFSSVFRVRRQERARFFSICGDGPETGPPFSSAPSLCRGDADRSLGVRFHLFGAHIEAGWGWDSAGKVSHFCHGHFSDAKAALEARRRRKKSFRLPRATH